jgi:methylmalonyl-CoA mutase N-terminal domain/subunit
VHKIDPETERTKIGMLRDVKERRDEDACQAALAKLTEQAGDDSVNLMPATIEAVKADATMGEIVNALERVFGRYVETPVF